jgi:uncharacterized cupin superfamily protein
MDIPDKLLDVQEHLGEGYKPLVDFEAWRVAILRFEDELRASNIHNMHRHDETDEVLVLLQGRCILFLGSGGAQIEQLFSVELEPGKLYNLRTGSWHNHVLSEDAVVVVVENRDTTLENSPRIELSEGFRAEIFQISQELGL